MTETIDIDFGILGSMEFKTGEAQFGDQFRDVMNRSATEGLPDEFKYIIEEAEQIKTKRAQLNFINIRINKLVVYTDDRVAFNSRDHWASPQEFIRQGGDCEDYAIAKFLTLMEIGFISHELRIVIVRDTRRKILHAVCTAPLNEGAFDDVMILDNVFDIPVSHIRILKYTPLYSFNRFNEWSHISTNPIRAKFVAKERAIRGI